MGIEEEERELVIGVVRKSFIGERKLDLYLEWWWRGEEWDTLRGCSRCRNKGPRKGCRHPRWDVLESLPE